MCYPSRLSGGQIQRLSLARTLYHDKSVYLFDEPTSALPASDKVVVMNNILNFLHDKIVIA